MKSLKAVVVLLVFYHPPVWASLWEVGSPCDLHVGRIGYVTKLIVHLQDQYLLALWGVLPSSNRHGFLQRFDRSTGDEIPT